MQNDAYTNKLQILRHLEQSVELFYKNPGTMEGQSAHETLINFFELKMTTEKIDDILFFKDTTENSMLQNLCWNSLIHSLQKRWTILSSSQREQALKNSLSIIFQLHPLSNDPKQSILFQNTTYFIALFIKQFYHEENLAKNFLILLNEFFVENNEEKIYIGIRLLNKIIETMNDSEDSQEKNQNNKINRLATTTLNFRNYNLVEILTTCCTVYKYWLAKFNTNTCDLHIFNFVIKELLGLFNSILLFNATQMKQISNSIINLPSNLNLDTENKLWSVINELELIESFFKIYYTHASGDNSNHSLIALKIINFISQLAVRKNLFIDVIFENLSQLVLNKTGFNNYFIFEELITIWPKIVKNLSQNQIMESSTLQKFIFLNLSILHELTINLNLENLSTIKYFAKFWSKVSSTLAGQKEFFVEKFAPEFNKINQNMIDWGVKLAKMIPLNLQTAEYYFQLFENLTFFSESYAKILWFFWENAVEKLLQGLEHQEKNIKVLVNIEELSTIILFLSSLLSYGGSAMVSADETTVIPAKIKNISIFGNALGRIYQLFYFFLQGSFSSQIPQEKLFLLQSAFLYFFNKFFANFFINKNTFNFMPLHEIICMHITSDNPIDLVKLFNESFKLLVNPFMSSFLASNLIKTLTFIVDQMTIGITRDYQEYITLPLYPVDFNVFDSTFLNHVTSCNHEILLSFKCRKEYYRILSKIIFLYKHMKIHHHLLQSFLQPYQKLALQNEESFLIIIAEFIGILLSLKTNTEYEQFLIFLKSITFLERLIEFLSVNKINECYQTKTLKFICELVTSRGSRINPKKIDQNIYNSIGNILALILDQFISMLTNDTYYRQLSQKDKYNLILKPFSQIQTIVSLMIENSLINTGQVKSKKETKFISLLDKIYTILGKLDIEDIISCSNASKSYLKMLVSISDKFIEILSLISPQAFQNMLIILKELLNSFDVNILVQVYVLLELIGNYLEQINKKKN